MLDEKVEKKRKYMKEYMKKARKENPEIYRDKRQYEKRKKEFQKRNKKMMEFLREYKSKKKCVYCGWNGHTEVLQFHHRNPNEKLDDVSTLVKRCVGKETILKEIAKCDVLCANCHAIETRCRYSSNGRTPIS